CDIIFTVLLNQTDYIPVQDYPDSKFLPIYPQEDLGGFFNGVLRFDNAKKTIKRGYEDTIKIIGPAYDLTKSQFAVEKCLQQIDIYNKHFQRYTEQKKILFDEVTMAVQSLQKDMGNALIGESEYGKQRIGVKK
ncbi:hypothetical protein QUF76_12420, partial [Desulfobacterales bacterium HSG16]|nr:hypothetical protein [Desulfobacterales bacterium HSG16]